ncbi:zinc finger protein 521-like isoform X2 [Belonocnema kinseyi]|uniref:zinc finger protein 521-like isoform X2 n=1 Tax=Belonocnema kinseyi TaxID=2817044 RepID=UPI00143DA306|nr:zinc finger protein 521-like isoform X2 [Belonocnema kinseyi]
MPRKRKLLNLSERCRLCLTENGEMRDLFTEAYCVKLKDLSHCTSIEIKSEQNLPKNVCHACVYKLEMWNEFKERFTRSNRLLLTRLEVAETTEYSKKSKFDETSTQCASPIFEEQNNKEKVLSPTLKSSSQKIINFTDIPNAEIEIKDNLNFRSRISNCPKFRQSARRGRTTERRKAYTRRWVARKKALIAASGNNSDTDSGASENQLSPVQKARAKSNAEKEEEKQKKIARALKNLETNMNDFKRGSDSDARRNLRSRKLNAERIREQKRKSLIKSKDKVKIKTKGKEMEKENFSSQPQTVKSELRIGYATYIVTSTLVISEPAYLNKGPNDSSNPEKNENTDIIDAVQLKRVTPVSNATADKRLLERCLNIEVEGTELETLQRVQVDLASFVEKDMKEKLFSENGILEELKAKTKDSYDSLDQQLKTIVVKAIKKNYETSSKSDNPELNEDVRKSKTISPEFVQAAMHSAVFQPKLILTRLDFSKVPYKINNVDILQRKPAILGSVSKKITSIEYEEENSLSDNDERLQIASLEHVKPKKMLKQQVESVECDTTTAHQDLQNVDQNHLNENAEISEEQEVWRNMQNCQIQEKKNIKHRCGICNRIFIKKAEAEEHIKQHHEATQKARQKMMRCKRCHGIVAAMYVKLHVCSQQFKCDYCGMSYFTEKAYINHVANHGDSRIPLIPQEHKCTICDKQFILEKELVVHLSTHDDSKSPLRCNVCNTDFISEEVLVNHLQTHDKLDFERPLRSKKKKQDRIEQTLDFERKVAMLKSEKKNQVEGPNKMYLQEKHEGYTCFVCDKEFNDEEVMKDHLQKHCDDMSEDERNSKEHYQCAICGESFESEDALGAHVENHLFDDEDDNPNLINITDNGKPKEVKYYCDQCPQVFSSKSILAMHKEAHDEDIAIAEWERQRDLMHNHSCTICDEIFPSEEDLAEHLDVHNGNAHVCLLCEKSFSTLSDLQAHVESH